MAAGDTFSPLSALLFPRSTSHGFRVDSCAAGSLIRPQYSETKAKTETETETNIVNSVAYESKTNRYAFIVDYVFEKINNE